MKIHQFYFTLYVKQIEANLFIHTLNICHTLMTSRSSCSVTRLKNPNEGTKGYAI